MSIVGLALFLHDSCSCNGMKNTDLSLVYFISLLFSSAIFAVGEGYIPTSVVRRLLSGDLYTISNENSYVTCPGDDTTFLVSERTCVTDQELINACDFAITPSDHEEISSCQWTVLTANINTDDSNQTRLVAAHNNNPELMDAGIISTDESCQRALAPSCHIASLEVYRGREEAIEIDHSGFSLSDKGIIEINRSNLAYGIEEFEGELYRMNLSCVTEIEFSESGCLFFKEAGRANVAEAKFNCTVPGTLDYNLEECNITPPTVTKPNIITSIVHTNIILSTPGVHNTPLPTLTEIESTVHVTTPVSENNILVPVIAPLIGGLTILIVGTGIITVYMIIRLWHSTIASTQGRQEQHQPHSHEEILSSTVLQNNPAYVHLSPVKSLQAAASVSSSCSQNPAYNIVTECGIPVTPANYSRQEPTYDVIQDRNSHTTVQGTPSPFSQNPASSHLDVGVQETGFQTDPTSPCDCSQNPAYGVYPNPN